MEETEITRTEAHKEKQAGRQGEEQTQVQATGYEHNTGEETARRLLLLFLSASSPLPSAPFLLAVSPSPSELPLFQPHTHVPADSCSSSAPALLRPATDAEAEE